ncbi:MAG: thioredoxin family protein [Phycisphaerales bacterium]
MHDDTRTTENSAPAPARKRLLARLPWGPILLVLAFVAVWAWLGRTAPTPPAFDTGLTLASAVDTARSGDRYVLAVATADWCAPCQGYKRGALVDPRVEAWIEDHAVPVYINIDESPGDARLLDVQGIPATYLIRDGQVVARASGAMGAGALLDWLDRARLN